jgi:hypothetical protein
MYTLLHSISYKTTLSQTRVLKLAQGYFIFLMSFGREFFLWHIAYFYGFCLQYAEVSYSRLMHLDKVLTLEQACAPTPPLPSEISRHQQRPG